MQDAPTSDLPCLSPQILGQQISSDDYVQQIWENKLPQNDNAHNKLTVVHGMASQATNHKS